MTHVHETERLQIKCLSSSYAQMVRDFYLRNAQYFEPYELTRPKNFYTIAFQTSMLDWESKEMNAFHCLRYFLFLKENPSYILGTVNLSNIRMGCIKCGSFGYKIDHAFWHQGYATEACRSILEILFRDYQLHRIEAEIMPENQDSIHVIEALGFSYEGLEREAAEINGAWQNLLLFSKLNPYSNSTIQ